jgi:hypothetical protein
MVAEGDNPRTRANISVRAPAGAAEPDLAHVEDGLCGGIVNGEGHSVETSGLVGRVVSAAPAGASRGTWHPEPSVDTLGYRR